MMEITAKEYLKSKGIWLGTTIPNMGTPEVYYSLEEMLEQYHQSKLKNHSDLSNVSGILLSMNQCRETIKMLKSTNTAKNPIAIDLYYKVVDYMNIIKKKVSDYR